VFTKLEYNTALSTLGKKISWRNTKIVIHSVLLSIEFISSFKDYRLPKNKSINSGSTFGEAVPKGCGLFSFLPER
jgi:hypothetical protein